MGNFEIERGAFAYIRRVSQLQISALTGYKFNNTLSFFRDILNKTSYIRQEFQKGVT